jgi:hypothetical protein
MLATIVLSALALAAATEKPALPLWTAIDCARTHALAQAPFGQPAAVIAEAAVEACGSRLDPLLKVRSQDPVVAERERATGAALHAGFLRQLRALALLSVEKERSRQ